MKNVSSLIGKYMAIIVVAVAALALLAPGTCLWIQLGWINYLLMIVMFGMGLTMKLSDFAVVFQKPRDVIVGCVAQFLVMPALAFALGKGFGLSDALLVGVVIFLVVILHNLLGYLCGFLIGKIFRMDLPRKKAVSIEIGMQNSGLATSLAASSFPNLAMATVPGAIFSVWHNISGAVLAGILRRIGE